MDIDLAVTSKMQMDMNSLHAKRNSDGRVARDRGLRRAQARARRRGRVTGPGQQGVIMLNPEGN
jgi:hypothetical protein